MPSMPHQMHVAIDYVSVAIFAAAPTVLGLSGPGAVICYALAGAHLLVTLITAAPGGVIRVLPNPFHGWIERVVGIVLLVGPWFSGDMLTSTGRLFFTAIGVVLLAVATFTDYAGEAETAEPV